MTANKQSLRRYKIEGLDLVLGGAIPTIAKLDDTRESTLILVRGGAGTGKTLFGIQLALDAAATRQGDVVVGLLEMLPTELRAQLTRIPFFQEGAIQVVSANDQPIVGEPPHIFASIMEVPLDGAPDIGVELHAVLSAARTAGHPVALVIDAVSREYRLGNNVPRELADGLSKFAAEENLIVIVLEEVSDQQYSPWTSAADVVFELALREADAHNDACRTLVVRKSRFSHAAIGPHTFVIHPERGIEIVPRSSQNQRRGDFTDR